MFASSNNQLRQLLRAGAVVMLANGSFCFGQSTGG